VTETNRDGKDLPQPDPLDSSSLVRRTDLNLIPALAALLDERHVTRAAETIGIGQPAMSSTLRRLRKLFKDPLLVRNGQILELTPLGRALIDPVHDVLAELDHLFRIQPTFDPGSDSRSFTIAASDYVTLVLLRPLLEQLHQEAPGVIVNVVPINLSTSIAIERGQLDLAIIPDQYMTSKAPYIQRRQLFTDNYVPVVAKKNRAAGDTLEREAMQSIPYVCYYDQACGPALVDQALADMGIEPRIALATASITMVPVLITGTTYFGFVLQRLLRHCHVRDDLRTLRTPVRIAPISQHMYWHPVLQRDPAHQWLRERTITLAANI
jgi:LysR family transcriptional regulator, nod-box dependent transcriptional activator